MPTNSATRGSGIPPTTCKVSTSTRVVLSHEGHGIEQHRLIDRLIRSAGFARPRSAAKIERDRRIVDRSGLAATATLETQAGLGMVGQDARHEDRGQPAKVLLGLRFFALLDEAHDALGDERGRAHALRNGPRAQCPSSQPPKRGVVLLDEFGERRGFGHGGVGPHCDPRFFTRRTRCILPAVPSCWHACSGDPIQAVPSSRLAQEPSCAGTALTPPSLAAWRAR